MIAALHVHAALRGKITYLKKSYFSPPFKLADITEDRRGKWLHLMQMSSSPGILDGDQFDIKIELDENCHLQLHTQSYQRLFSMKTGATQKMEVFLGKGSSFVYLPHPGVPQENSIFTTRNKIFLSEKSELIWGEIITCGRKLNGEIFRFLKYHAVTEVYINNRLKIKENICLIPTEIEIGAIGMLEGFTHQASLIFIRNGTDNNTLIEKIRTYLDTHSDMLFGVTPAPESGLLVRILGNKSEQLMDALKAIAKILKKEN